MVAFATSLRKRSCIKTVNLYLMPGPSRCNLLCLFGNLNVLQQLSLVFANVEPCERLMAKWIAQVGGLPGLTSLSLSGSVYGPLNRKGCIKSLSTLLSLRELTVHYLGSEYGFESLGQIERLHISFPDSLKAFPCSLIYENDSDTSEEDGIEYEVLDPEEWAESDVHLIQNIHMSQKLWAVGSNVSFMSNLKHLTMDFHVPEIDYGINCIINKFIMLPASVRANRPWFRSLETLVLLNIGGGTRHFLADQNVVHFPTNPYPTHKAVDFWETNVLWSLFSSMQKLTLIKLQAGELSFKHAREGEVVKEQIEVFNHDISLRWTVVDERRAGSESKRFIYCEMEGLEGYRKAIELEKELERMAVL